MKRICMALALLVVATTARAQGYTVIVNASAPASPSKEEIANVFLKKASKWSNGAAAAPVDQDKSSKTREAFTKAVLGRSTSAVESYWQQQIFAGKDVPPAEKGSDDAVIAFVKATPGAVGYVSPGATLPPDVKAVGTGG